MSFFPDTGAQNNNIIIIIITRTRPRFCEHLIVYPFRGGGGGIGQAHVKRHSKRCYVPNNNTFLAFREKYNNII
jgi:hypothetical protein